MIQLLATVEFELLGQSLKSRRSRKLNQRERNDLMITTTVIPLDSLQSKPDQLRQTPLGPRPDVRKDAIGESSMLRGLFRPIVGTIARWPR